MRETRAGGDEEEIPPIIPFFLLILFHQSTFFVLRDCKRITLLQLLLSSLDENIMRSRSPEGDPLVSTSFSPLLLVLMCSTS